jgi:cytochrome o ubiquinol oxidase subunit II
LHRDFVRGNDFRPRALSVRHTPFTSETQREDVAMNVRLPSFGRLAPPPSKRVFAVAMLIAPLVLSGCADGVLQPRGPIGGQNSIILFDAVGIMAAIVVPTIAAVLIFAWWFRASNTRAQYRPDFVYSGRIEIIVWAIPILVILFLSGVIWIGAHELDPFRPLDAQQKPTEVDVVSLDWKWLFIYPDQDIASVNALTVPVGVPVHFRLTSATVMNSFFVPQLGSMIATMYGMVTQLYLKADQAGDYYGESTQYSGDGFSDMHFVVHAVPQQAFDRWVAGARARGPQLDRAGYLALLRESQNNAPFTFRSVEPHLFDAIVRQQLPDGPGPQNGNGGPEVSPIGDR